MKVVASLLISASSGFAALISSITDLFVLLAVNDIRSNLHQHHNSKLSIILLSAFLIVQDSQPYSTTWKTDAFIIRHFVVIVTVQEFILVLFRLSILINFNRSSVSFSNQLLPS